MVNGVVGDVVPFFRRNYLGEFLSPYRAWSAKRVKGCCMRCGGFLQEKYFGNRTGWRFTVVEWLGVLY